MTSANHEIGLCERSHDGNDLVSKKWNHETGAVQGSAKEPVDSSVNGLVSEWRTTCFNAPPHNQQKTICSRRIHYIWPGNSPYINPIANVWDLMNRQMV